MNEKIDGLLKNSDPAKNLNLREPGDFSPRPKRAFITRERFALQGRGPRLATMAGAFVAVVGLSAAVIGLAPQSGAPIMTLGSAQGNESRATLGAAKVAGDMAMMPWFQYEYQAADDFQGVEPTNTMYRLKMSGDPKQILAAVAKAVGVTGSVERADAATFGSDSYFVGSKDWSGPTAMITTTGMGNWSFNDPNAYPQCAPEPSDSKVTGWCSNAGGTSTTSDFPSNATAAALAARIFAAGGLSVSPSEIKIYKDDYNMTATASLSVAGQPTALTWQAGWSPIGKLAYAYGQSVSVEKVSDVATIDAKSAISRLGDWRWSGQPAETFYPNAPIVYDQSAGEGVATKGGDTATGSGSSSSSSGATVEPSEATTPPDDGVLPSEEPMPTPEVKVFMVSKAVSALLLTWDADGNAWLVPGYFFSGSDGIAGAVFAVADGVIKLPPADDAVMPMVK